MNLVKSIYMLFTIIVCVALFVMFYGNDETQASPISQESYETVHEIDASNPAQNGELLWTGGDGETQSSTLYMTASK